MMGRKPKIFIILSLLMFGYLLIYFNDQLFRRRIYIHSLNKQLIGNQSKETPSFKIILLWTDYFGMKWPEIKPLTCYCDLTTDRRHLKSASAIVYHLQDLEINDVPDKQKIESDANAKDETDAQRFVIPPYLTFSLRTPDLNAIDDLHIDYFMTYRRDSDIYIPYGRIKKRQTPIKRRFNETLFHTKRRDSAWFVSNCKSESRGEEYVNELIKYVDVDVYGKCGCYSCERRLDADKNFCYQKVETDYKFYLSFENSICKEYVTKKLFNILNYDTIPIVYGDANEYQKIMPKNSYLDATKYKPKELASVMKNISSNYSLYSSFFDWKNEHFVDPLSWEETFCKLCDKLQQKTPKDASPKKKIKFKKWWFEDANCVKKNN